MKQIIDPKIKYFTHNNKNYVNLSGHIFEADEKGYPIIYCQKWGAGLKFYCPFCLRWHFHGFGDGYRYPHCLDFENPFHRLGAYCLELKTREVKHD